MLSAPVCIMENEAGSEYLFKKCSRKPLLQGDLSHHGVKEKYQPLYQKLVLNMWNDSRNNTNLGNRFTILLSFCNGCKLGANRGSVGATPGFPFSLTKLFFTFTTQTCAKSLHLSFDPLAPCYSALCFLLLVSNKS